MYRRGRNSSNFGLMLLILNVAQIGLENIPPATLGFLAINTLIFYFNPLQHSLGQVCIGAFEVLRRYEVHRLLLAAFYHVNDMHLYYNMSSLIWKGRQLEPILGTKRFVWLMIVLAVISNTLLVGTDYLFESYDCAVGFSAVLFGLKVVLQHLTPERTSLIMGAIPISSKYVYWAELLLIQILVPNASFLGHLCGIVAGLLYIYGFLEPLFLPLTLLPDLDFRSQREPPSSSSSQYQYRTYENPWINIDNPPRRRVVRNGVLS